MISIHTMTKYINTKNFSACLKLINPSLSGKIFPVQTYENRIWNKYFSFHRRPEHRVDRMYVPNRLSTPNTMSGIIKRIKEETVVSPKMLKNAVGNDAAALSNLSEEEVQLLLEQCGDLLPNESVYFKNNLCQAIFTNIRDTNKITINILHTYISICTQNKVILKYSDFLALEDCIPTKDTYKLLLWNIAEGGDPNQVSDLLVEMRNKNIPLDRDVFNALVFTHTSAGGLADGESVLETMRALQISENPDTIFYLYRGLAVRNNIQDFQNVIEKYPISFDEKKLLKIIEDLSLNNNIHWLEKVLSLEQNTFSREFFMKLDQLCIRLVHSNKPSAAVKVYKEFVIPVQNIKYGTFLFQEMFRTNTKIADIIKFADEFKVLNSSIFIDITEISMRTKRFSDSWILLHHLPYLRPHFFWPLLLDAQKETGEDGILNALKRMIDLKVDVDIDTLVFYCIPYCNMDNIELSFKKLKSLDLPVRTIVNSIIVFLLRTDNTKSAVDFHTRYSTILDSGKIFKQLPYVWSRKNDAISIVYFLQKACELDSTGSDLVGEFLIKCLRLCSNSSDFSKYLNLVGTIGEKKLRLTTDLADVICNILSHKCQDRSLYEQLTLAIESLMDYSLELNRSPIVHPKNMSLEQLECHLIELKAKDMYTRGVIRKLMQKHANMGNTARVNELQKQFLAAGYKESAGMKASMMQSFIQGSHLEDALNLYNELAMDYPEFRLDAYKVIDLACLMVRNKFNSKAQEIVGNDSRKGLVKGGSSIERNCWKLLSAYENESDQSKMLNLLIEKGYCKPTNVILGPSVRLQLKNSIEHTAKLFIDLSRKYKCTPLKLEVLCSILNSGKKDYLQEVLDAVSTVHGTEAANEALFVALVETRLENAILKFLSASKGFSKQRLEKVLEKWINEDKLDCLLTIKNTHTKVPSKLIDINKINECIIQVYINREDCKNAIGVYENFDDKMQIDCQIEDQLYKLIEKCKYQVPSRLQNKTI